MLEINIENPKESTYKLLEYTNTFSRIARCKEYILKSIVFAIYIKNENNVNSTVYKSIVVNKMSQ